jgi:glutamine amidotransferase
MNAGSNKMIVIPDYGMGNFGSIRNMLKYLGIASEITRDPQRIRSAGKIILAGVGTFDNGIRNIRELGFLEPLSEKALVEKAPILGICLGMQLMSERSEEGKLPGLGWFAAETVRFKLPTEGAGLKIPHMGWNVVSDVAPNPLSRDLVPGSRFYFVHSYYVVCRESRDVWMKTAYGLDFVSAIRKENLYGVQFHPEKSHRFGMAVLRNFAELPDGA